MLGAISDFGEISGSGWVSCPRQIAIERISFRTRSLAVYASPHSRSIMIMVVIYEGGGRGKRPSGGDRSAAPQGCYHSKTTDRLKHPSGMQSESVMGDISSRVASRSLRFAVRHVVFGVSGVRRSDQLGFASTFCNNAIIVAMSEENGADFTGREIGPLYRRRSKTILN